MQILKEVSKKEFKDFLYNINLNDKKLYDEINRTQFGIFQFSGNTASRMIQQSNPKCFNDVVSINALSRPGSSFSFPSFVNNGKTNESNYPKVVSDLLTESRSCILFQEQIMNIFHVIGGFSLEKTNYIRSLMKKLGKANKKKEDLIEWDNQVKIFKEGAIKKGLTEKQSNDIAEDMMKLSSYSFNRSHAFAYSYLAMETVYLSEYFKTYYYSACLSYDASKKDALKNSIKSVSKDGYSILEPDVNLSKEHFNSDGKAIRFGLEEIKGVGEEPLKLVIQKRPYTSIIDFVLKNIDSKGVTKRITNALVCGGAFDNLIPENKRSRYDKIVNYFYENKKTIKTPELLKEKWEEAERQIPDEETTPSQYIKYEEEYLGGNFFHGMFSKSMMEKIEILVKSGKCCRNFNEIREKNLSTRYVPVEVKSYRYHTDKKGNEMIFIEVEDSLGESFSIPIFASYWEYCKIKFFGEGFYLLSVYPTEDNKIMFGSKNWVSDPNRKKSFMIKWTII